MAGIKLGFKGVDYSIAENRAFEAAEVVEDVMTIQDLSAMMPNPKFTKIARCFGALLRFAGAEVSDAEVKREMMREISQMTSETEQEQAKGLLAAQAIESLLTVLMDGAPEGDAGEDTGKAKAS